MTESISYSSRFQDPSSAAAYELGEYGANSYSTCVWRWQQPVLERLIGDFRRSRSAPVRLLDFACGTGRVLAAVESWVDAAEGVDISENMAALARAKCHRAQIKVGDILTQAGLLRDRYEMITAFRFLLNVEPELRQQVLCKLRRALLEPGGLLVVNVHGNSRSLRHPAILWRRWRERSRSTGGMLNEMSPAECRALLNECGFRVVRQFGFGFLPPTLYRTPLRVLAELVDQCLAGERPWRNCAIDLLFVCQPR